MKWFKANSNEGKTLAISDAEARDLLERPDSDMLNGKRDWAILAILLYYGIWRVELCSLRMKDVESHQGLAHLRIFGKGSKIRFLPAYSVAQRLIAEYLDYVGHGEDADGPLFARCVITSLKN